jgi:hypothetical protein
MLAFHHYLLSCWLWLLSCWLWLLSCWLWLIRQPGLAKIYEQLLGFEGDEFYIEAWPQTIGKPFGDLFQHFPDAIPLVPPVPP